MTRLTEKSAFLVEFSRHQTLSLAATLFIDGCWGLDSRGSAKDIVVHRGESGSSSAGKKLIPAAALLLMIFSAMNSYDTVASVEGECDFAAVETSSRSSTNCADNCCEPPTCFHPRRMSIQSFAPEVKSDPSIILLFKRAVPVRSIRRTFSIGHVMSRHFAPVRC